MNIDGEGHILVSPREISERIHESHKLINNVLIPGTPVAFPTHEGYCDFLNACADTLGIHPRNLLMRGSSKLGFSVSPHIDSIWVSMHPESDLDFAIIDPDYYHYLDREIRMYERHLKNRALRGPEYKKSVSRRGQRAFYTYRYFDLPDIPCVADHNARLKALPVKACCGLPRPIDAFVFRDWWSLYSRWEYDLQDLGKALNAGTLPKGGDAPRPYEDTL